MKTIKDIAREMRRRALDFKGGNLPTEAVIAAGEDMELFADRIEAAAHNNPTCINCVAVEKWKAKQAAANLEKRKVKEAIDGLMACCEYRTCIGTCGLLDKDDRTYTCSRANCPHIDDKAVRP